MTSFSQRFEIIYKIYLDGAAARGQNASKRALAKFLGVTQGRMQCWEKGQMPTANDLKLLREKLGLSYLWLIEGIGEPVESTPPSPMETDKLADLEKENFMLKNQLANAEAELREERTLNRKLTNRLLDNGMTDEKSVTITAKAVGQE